MPDPKREFSLAMPIPYIQQPAERVEQLKRFLQTEFGQAERVNVEALIRMYETGELGPQQIGDPPAYLVEGHRVHTDPHEDMSVLNNAMKWCETLDYRQ
ncbi:uncharacterized protein N7484_011475 [Penicillium longicatenatum]|uniref:uncharacterized protein n=1 Tax=Penicillium longicatenatum TaxID=1561947 RepID=UPI0025475D2B|nr:uncharacterized protein N7484_011475 [Penicillium longicatenatum]KAJ5631375.1 hypothetical protein N7484_011475 [Penicillium longicatenatum]